MGRERQKQKNRSSVSKVTRKPKSKKRILSNSIIAANWDKSQTLAQNYRRLGLTAKLNKSTGGVEKKASDVGNGDGDRLRIDGAKQNGQIVVKEAKIERDPQTGRILKVLDSDNAKANPLNDALNEFDSDSDEGGFDHHGRSNPTRIGLPKTDVIGQLEHAASLPAPKYKRKQSEAERAFVAELVRKHGDDYTAMARDMKVNYMQRTEGDLKRRIKKWRENGSEVE